jgi:ABC-type multidrug transport system fused ATPase/permease subunit
MVRPFAKQADIDGFLSAKPK